jgi:hypothetical protein
MKVIKDFQQQLLFEVFTRRAQALEQAEAPLLTWGSHPRLSGRAKLGASIRPADHTRARKNALSS